MFYKVKWPLHVLRVVEGDKASLWVVMEYKDVKVSCICTQLHSSPAPLLPPSQLEHEARSVNTRQHFL